MSFDLKRLRERVGEGPLARVVVAATQGSVPREVGAAMLVGHDWSERTIGGGALEFDAMATARRALGAGTDRLDRVPLGPALGQCCGGAVTLLTEIWMEDRLSRLPDAAAARALPGHEGIAPLTVRRLTRNPEIAPGIVDGWMIEPYAAPDRSLWIWGAGHVGRALVSVLAPLPGLSVNWADFDRDRFPDRIPDGVEMLIASSPERLVSLAPTMAEHFVVTHSHALDLEICHRVLHQPFGFLGLIGSQTKWARFRSKLKALGNSDAEIGRITCPIGDPALGKHPQQIAVGVASAILTRGRTGAQMTELKA